MIKHLNSKKIKPERVIVFGGGGYIGREIVKELNRNNITTLNISSNQLNLIYTASVNKLASLFMEKDIILILAAITPDKGKEIEDFNDNIQMMINILKAINKTKEISQIIYFSSDAVYGRRQGMVNEETKPEPSDIYGVMHLCREQLLLSYTANIEKLIINLNIIETNFKRNELAQDTQFFYFLTQNLSKVAFKNANNFI